MAQTILGLDIGSSSVKAVLLRRTLMGLEWAGAYQMDLPGAPSAFDWGKNGVAGLKDWLAQSRLPTDRVVTAVPLHLLSLRTLSLPFTDPNRIAKVVAFELESLLPYNLDEVIVDYESAAETNGRAHVLAAAVPRGLLKHLLDQLSASGVDPESVEPDATALLSLARFALSGRAPSPGGAPAGDTMVLDLGASKTTIGILSGGLPAYVRTVMQGGRHLTAALQQKCQITPEEAEEWKCQAGLMDEAITRFHEKNVSRTLTEALEPLIGELARTIHVYESGEAATEGLKPKRSITEFMLCGGGAKLKGLEEYLAAELGLQPAPLVPNIATTNGRRWDPSFALGFGLALKGARIAGASRMNFRKEAFSYTKEARAASHRARFLWIGALLVAAAAGADLYMNYSLKEGRYRELKAEVRTQFREMFPEVKNIVDEVQQAKSAVADLRKRSNLLGAAGRSPLQLMAELTRRMPASVKVEVQDLVIEPARLRLEAETNTFDSVDKIKAAIEESDAFKDVTVSDAKVSADQSKVKFRLTVTLAEKDSGEARP